jgi:hypothetical protein
LTTYTRGLYSVNERRSMEEKVYTREWFVQQGKKGGLKTKKLYGLNHYSKINPKRKKKQAVDKPLDNPPV